MTYGYNSEFTFTYTHSLFNLYRNYIPTYNFIRIHFLIFSYNKNLPIIIITDRSLGIHNILTRVISI